MIIDNTYFKGEIYIPYAKPGITDSVTGVENDIISFINEYSENCLFKSLGPNLFADLKLNLDPNDPTWVDPLADQKWDDLVNGKQYTDPATNLTAVWKGIRYINNSDGVTYDRSFLAYYTYFYYEKKEYVTRSGIGHEQEKAHNAITVTPTNKVVHAWNKFVSLVQGDDVKDEVILNSFGFGIDYYSGNNEVSLYKFINDSNTISEGTYANFKPKLWKKMNTFNL